MVGARDVLGAGAEVRGADRWIGWDFGVQFDRLHLVTNNSRFLILLSTAEGKPYQRWYNLGMISTILKVIWEMSVYLFDCAMAEEGEEP